MIKLILPLSLGVASCCIPLWAADSSMNPIQRFTVRPAVCVTEKNAQCKTRFVFSWSLNYATQVCLSLKGAATTLVCSQKLRDEKEVDIKSRKTSVYELTPTDLPLFSVSQEVQVLELNRDVRVVNRRVWSVF
ncbi:DUF3019 domain-containing protein [Pseudoalteromonas sp. GB56]